MEVGLEDAIAGEDAVVADTEFTGGMGGKGLGDGGLATPTNDSDEVSGLDVLSYAGDTPHIMPDPNWIVNIPF